MAELVSDGQLARVFAIAYNITGSRADAEDIVQETLVRWWRADHASVRSPEAFLATIATRLSLNQLRARRARREELTGDWLPEPLDTPQAPDEERLEAISFGFLALLERLTPLQRAVFVLRNAFEYDYADIAGILRRDEAACRKAFSRAQAAIREGRPRYPVPYDVHRDLLVRFLAAVENADMHALTALLADDVTIRGEGSKGRIALARPLQGSTRVAKFVVASVRFLEAGAEVSIETMNGAPAAMFRIAGELVLAILIECAQEKIVDIFAIAKPDKLRLCGQPRPGTLGHAR